MSERSEPNTRVICREKSLRGRRFIAHVRLHRLCLIHRVRKRRSKVSQLSLASLPAIPMDRLLLRNHCVSQINEGRRTLSMEIAFLRNNSVFYGHLHGSLWIQNSDLIFESARWRRQSPDLRRQRCKLPGFGGPQPWDQCGTSLPHWARRTQPRARNTDRQLERCDNGSSLSDRRLSLIERRAFAIVFRGCSRLPDNKVSSVGFLHDVLFCSAPVREGIIGFPMGRCTV
jgi:hypothetical protein